MPKEAITREIPKAYEPQEIEERWAKSWFDEKLFRAENSANGPPFSIALPPPNITGSIHIGHMLEHTQIDMLVRWHRMRGDRTLWLPGMDHAGIATQYVVERQLAKEKLRRQDLGREEFEKRVWKWKAESGGVIKDQMIRLGASCDWTRERFTLEPALYRAVIEAFLRLYREGLIYRGRYIVNWCPRCQTAISDLEVVHHERAGEIWNIRYPIAGSKEFLVVATTRPETMLGDTAVAVHPDDERYQRFIGKTVILPLMNREIPIIADTYVDREFGTGAVKITPAHDPNDFEIGKRHNLPQIDVMTSDGHMSEAAGKYAGVERFAARARIVSDLKELGLLEGVKEHMHAVGVCDRCKSIVEPRISTQWFMKMKPLAEPAEKVVREGLIEVVPENQRTVLLHWLENIRDWCISRQLWWGHRIPIWHCAGCDEMVPATDSRVEIVEGHARAAGVPPQCPKCGGKNLTQDTDVLDTWFSSALWPFSTLGWPDDTEDLRTFYPTSLLISGYDILFFWDVRMIMMGLHLSRQRLTGSASHGESSRQDGESESFRQGTASSAEEQSASASQKSSESFREGTASGPEEQSASASQKSSESFREGTASSAEEQSASASQKSSESFREGTASSPEEQRASESQESGEGSGQGTASAVPKEKATSGASAPEGILGGRSFSSDMSPAPPGALAPEDTLASSVPFRRLYLHSLVRTAEGAKMSKTKGTGVDPLQLTQQYGTDALRYMLASMAAPGTDIALTEDRILGARAFANKIWNAARFLFVNLEKVEANGLTLDELAAPEIRAKAPYPVPGEGALAHRWIFSRLSSVAAQVNDALENFRFHEACQTIYQFFWGDFCDWYIEWVKPQLVNPSREIAVPAWRNIFAALDAALRLLHPAMPFLTEELWHKLPRS